jgi:hypothetical protein
LNFANRCWPAGTSSSQSATFRSPKIENRKRVKPKKKKLFFFRPRPLTPSTSKKKKLDLDDPKRNETTRKTGNLPSPPSFLPGQPWFDSDGNAIQAHGGSALKTPDGTYWWYGEDKSGKSYETSPGGHWRVDTVGVAAYWSRDLISWHRSPKLALAAVPEIPDLHPKTSILERPKVVYNARTKK